MTTNVRDLIRIVLNDAEEELRADKVHDRVTNNGIDISERRIKEALRDMHEEGELSRTPENDGTRGRPAYRYHRNSDDDSGSGNIAVRSVRVRGEFDPQEDENLPEGVYWDVVDEQLDSSETVKKVKQIAPEIADEDPVELLTKMAEWTVSQLEEYGNELIKKLREGNTGLVRALRSEYEDLADWADYYFHRFYRLPSRDDPRPTALYMPDVEEYIHAGKNSDDEEAPSPTIDVGKVKTHLSDRVFGDTLIDTVKINDQVTDTVGTDASVSTVSLPSPSRLAPETTFDLFVGAAALEQENRRFNDFDFNPRSIRDFRHREAFKDGLLISEHTLPLSEGERVKAQRAAMDLRQYRQCHRVIDDEADWQPYGNFDEELSDYSGPDVMFMDGRLTPLVHLLSEFIKPDLYGELVRREIREFAKLADYADDDNWQTDTVFAGVVKRPGISWLAPIVFWYMQTHSEDIAEFDISNVYRPPLSDVVLPHILFAGLSEAEGEPDDDCVYTTARVLRRYSDNSIPKYDLPPVDVDDNPIDITERSGWMKYFEKVQQRRANRGQETIEIDNFEHFGFAELCANVGTLMCYAGPPNLYQQQSPDAARLPRMEVLVNPPVDASNKLQQAISLFAKTTTEDREHAAEDFSTMNDLPVIVPSVITQSDDAAKIASERMREEVSRNIQRLVSALSE
jgi:hypothetical protein